MSMTPPDQAGMGSGAQAMAREAPSLPSFVTAKDLAQGERLFFGPGRAVRRGLAAIAVLATLMLFGAVAGAAFGASVSRDIIVSAAVAAIACGALWFLASVFRMHPARLCYVRADAREGARHFTRELRPYGHVIVYRAQGRAGDAQRVASSLRNRVALNLRALFSDHQTMTLSAEPSLTRLLAGASDALIVDLSNRAPEDWALMRPYASRCVFVSAWPLHEQADATLASLGLPGQCFFYAPDGEIQRRGQFRAALLAAMRAAHA